MLEEMDRKNLGRYTIVKRLGGGGMGAVYKGRDITLNRDVAIKVMHPHIASRPNFRERFLQEARVAARLDHPSIVQVYDFGQDSNLLYIVMEYIAGPNLESMLRDMRAQNKWIVLSEAVELVRQVSLALNYAHEQGVLHRDIKPANIMIEPVRSGKLAYRPVLTDLGLAKLTEGGMVTEDGVSMGTPAYMSPEQALGKQTDRRSDVYSLGVLLYELATGRAPFPIKSLTEAIRYHTQEEPPSPRSIRPDLPAGLEQVILKAMAKNPDDRYPTAEALAEALETTTDAVTQVKAGSTEMEGAESLITNYQKSIVEERGPSLMDEFAQPSSFSQDRIQVLGPDKRTTSVPVKRPSMTIGRSGENDLVLDDSKVSRQHARIEYDNGAYKVTDLNSSNGTFLANTRLLPGVPEAWMPNQALRLGDHWLRVVRAQTEGTVGSNMPHQTYSADQFRTSMGNQVGIFLEDKQLSVEPGGSLTIQVVVLNQSNLVDQFRVRLEGVPERWVKVAPEEASLMPGEQAPVNVMVQPPRSASSRAGRYPVSLKVTSKESPAQVAEESATITLGAFSQFTSEMQPQKLRSGQSAQITVTNNGNTHDTFTLSHSDRGEELVFMPSKAQLRVPEGQSAAAKFKVQSRQRRFIGGEKTYAFTSQVTSTSGESKMHSGEMTDRALLPPWLIPALLVMFACLGAGALLIYGGITGRAKNAQATADARSTAVAINVLNTENTQTAVAIGIVNAKQATSEAATATLQAGAQQTTQAGQATQQAAQQTAQAQTQVAQDNAAAQTQAAQTATQMAQANQATQQAAQQTAQAATQTAQANIAATQTAQAATQTAQANIAATQTAQAATQTAEASKPKVAYVYSTDSGMANQFKSLFVDNGYQFVMIRQSDVLSVDFSPYRLVLIGHETGNSSDWRNDPWGDSAKQQAQHIYASGKPVIGLGYGGSLFFQAVGLYINWGQSATNSSGVTQAIPDNTGDNMWKSPNAISLSGGAATLYGSNSGYVGVYIPDPVNGVTTLARPSGSPKYAVLALENSKYLLWGFEGGPAAMTVNGKAAMINAARRILPTIILPFPIPLPILTPIIKGP